MNGQWISVLGVVVASLVGFFSARLSVKAQNRKTDAEARVLEAQAQAIITKGWNADLARRDTKITKLEDQNSKLEQRLEAIDSDLQDAHEQNDLLADQLAEERKANRLLSAALETAQAHLKAALAELDNAKDQIVVLVAELKNSKNQTAVLTEHARRMDVWLVNHFAKNGHADDPDKPPTLTPFDVSEEDT